MKCDACGTELFASKRAIEVGEQVRHTRERCLEAQLAEAKRKTVGDEAAISIASDRIIEFKATIARLEAHLAECERERDEMKVGRAKPTASELLQRGGEWLGAARNWMQWHRHNGDSVTWGSNEELRPPMTARDVEELASEVASAAMRPQPSEERVERLLRARWDAEAKLRATAAKLAVAEELISLLEIAEHAQGPEEWTRIEELRKALASLDPPEAAEKREQKR